MDGFCSRCGAKGREVIVNRQRKAIVCNDGTKLSVQVGQSLYCHPREDEGPWETVEVGYPSVVPPPSWADYADGDYPADVYAYVPVRLVEEYIALHGGRKLWS